MNQVDALLQGDRLALARTLTQIENDTPDSRRILDILFQHAGNAHIIGITGPTGSGKSTLVNRLAKTFRQPEDGQAPLKVAVLAVDPTSPFSGGAVLGDRVRMRDLTGDTGVFIRSVATRGTLGGLSQAASEMVTAMDAAGYDIILVETVGVGQSEIEIARLAHTVLLVENPGTGDDIQTIKAGILEIADVIAINKADRPGVEQTEQALRMMLDLNNPSSPGQADMHHYMESDWGAMLPADSTEPAWDVPIIRTIATEEKGITELSAVLKTHFDHLKTSGLWRNRQNKRLRRDLENLIRDVLFQTWITRMNPEEYDRALDRLFTRSISPFHLAEELIVSDFANKTNSIHLK